MQPWEGPLFQGVWQIHRHCTAYDFGGLVKGELCKNGRNDLYVVWCVFVQGVAFWGYDDWTCIKIFNDINF